MTHETALLSSEARELKSLLAGIPADNIIERMSLEARLERVQASLHEMPPSRPEKSGSPFAASQSPAVRG